MHQKKGVFCWARIQFSYLQLHHIHALLEGSRYAYILRIKDKAFVTLQ